MSVSDIVALSGAASGLLISVATLVTAVRTHEKVTDVSLRINGRLDEMIASRVKEAHVSGLLDGATAAVAAQTTTGGHPSMTGAELQ